MSDSIFEQILTINLQAERAILAYSLVDEVCLKTAREKLHLRDFVDEDHALLWGELAEVESVDSATLPRILKTMRGKREDAAAFIASIVVEGEHWQGTKSISRYFDFYLRELIDSSKLRSKLAFAESICEGNGVADPDVAAIAEADELRGAVTKSKPFRDTLVDTLALLDREKINETRSRFGVPVIDEVFGGMCDGEVCVVAALPGRGKTCFALQVAAHNLNRGRRVFLFSMEMNEDSVHRRFISHESRVNLARVFDGNLGPTDRQSIVESANRMGEWNLEVKTGALTIGQVEDNVRSMAEEGKPDLIVVDYLQLMRHADPKSSLHVRAVDNSRGIVQLAKSIGAPVLLLAQLNREAAKEDYPKRHQLRDSGTIEQDADQIVLLSDVKEEHQPAVEIHATEQFTRFDIAKNRRGSESIRVLAWERATQTFRDPSEDDQMF